MKLVAKPKLSEENIQDLIRFYKLCNEHDGTKYSFDEDLDFQKEGEINTFLLYKDEVLVSSLHIFAPSREEAEITALTLPLERRNGYFTHLLAEAYKEIKNRDINSILFVCDVRSLDGVACVSSIQADYEFSEFLMQYDNGRDVTSRNRTDIVLEGAKERDFQRYVEINSQAFKDEEETKEIIQEFFASDKRELFGIKVDTKLVGMIGVYKEAFRDYIHGFAVDPEYQGKGIGRYALQKIVERCSLTASGKKIVLEVQTDNANALKLYTSVGFSIETEFRYYRKSIIA